MKDEEINQISRNGLQDKKSEQNLEIDEKRDDDETHIEGSKESEGLDRILQNVASAFHSYRVDWWDRKRWLDYMNKTRDLDCLHLPKLNEYLCSWDEDDSYDVKKTFKRCHECLKFIDDLKFALLAGRHGTEKELNSWKEGIQNIKKTISKKLDFISFMLLKDAEKYLDAKAENMEFMTRDSEGDICVVTVCLWANVYRAVRKRGMSMLGFSFRLPLDVAAKDCAVRLMHTLFDHVTQEKQKTENNVIKIKEEISMDDILAEQKISHEENGEVTENVDGTDESPIQQKVVNEEEEVDYETQEEIIHLEESQTSLEKAKYADFEDSDGNAEESQVHITSASIQEKEIQIVDSDEYFVVGGIYYFELFVVPDLTVCRGAFTFISKQVPQLRRIHYRRKIIPPGSLDGTTSDDMYEKRRFEKELSEAIFVQFRLPSSVIFLENPEPARWYKDKNGYSKDSVFEAKYVKDEKIISFITNQFGIFGMLQKKYQNFPYKKWTLKVGNPVTLNMDGKYMNIYIDISDAGYTVKSLNVEEDIILLQINETFMFAEQLVEKLRSIGINIEINSNAEKFVDIMMKDPVVENKVYDCMALLCKFCSFSSVIDDNISAREDILLEFCIEKEDTEMKKVLIRKDRIEGFNVNEKNEEKSVEDDNVEIEVQSAEIEQELEDKSQDFPQLEEHPRYTDLYNFAIDKMNEETKEDIISTNICLIENVRSLLRICRLISSLAYKI